MKITFTDANGQQITIEVEKCDFYQTVGRIVRREADLSKPVLIDDRRWDATGPRTRETSAAYDAPIRINTTQMQTFDAREVYAPAPTSARWEGPPPRRVRRC